MYVWLIRSDKDVKTARVIQSDLLFGLAFNDWSQKMSVNMNINMIAFQLPKHFRKFSTKSVSSQHEKDGGQ